MRGVKNDRRHVCSPECRKLLVGHTGSYSWANDAAWRARRLGCTEVDVFEATQVFERDGWTCYLCNRPVGLEVDIFHPDSPTVDHVVPLTKGGAHALHNVRCAHLGCNSRKADRLLTAVA